MLNTGTTRYKTGEGVHRQFIKEITGEEGAEEMVCVDKNRDTSKMKEGPTGAEKRATSLESNILHVHLANEKTEVSVSLIRMSLLCLHSE